MLTVLEYSEGTVRSTTNGVLGQIKHTCDSQVGSKNPYGVAIANHGEDIDQINLVVLVC